MNINAFDSSAKKKKKVFYLILIVTPQYLVAILKATIFSLQSLYYGTPHRRERMKLDGIILDNSYVF